MTNPPRYDYLDHKGWRYEWIDGILNTANIPEDRLKALGNREPKSVSLRKLHKEKKE